MALSITILTIRVRHSCRVASCGTLIRRMLQVNMHFLRVDQVLEPNRRLDRQSTRNMGFNRIYSIPIVLWPARLNRRRWRGGRRRWWREGRSSWTDGHLNTWQLETRSDRSKQLSHKAFNSIWLASCFAHNEMVIQSSATVPLISANEE